MARIVVPLLVDVVAELLRTGAQLGACRVVNGIPYDAKLVSASIEGVHLLLVFESPSASEDGETYLEIEPQ